MIKVEHTGTCGHCGETFLQESQQATWPDFPVAQPLWTAHMLQAGYTRMLLCEGCMGKAVAAVKQALEL